jgi:hypothetical protein
MTQIVMCTGCFRKLQVPEQYFGKTVQCPECKEMFTAKVPAATLTPADPPLHDQGFDLFPETPAATVDREEADEDDWPRRHRAPHRGPVILAFGILALLGFTTVLFGPLAWILGNADLRDMREGRMDPSGAGQTNAGRIIGMIATLLLAFSVVAGCLAGAAIVALALFAVPQH